VPDWISGFDARFRQNAKKSARFVFLPMGFQAYFLGAASASRYVVTFIRPFRHHRHRRIASGKQRKIRALTLVKYHNILVGG
jgi:hypothetical protein